MVLTTESPGRFGPDFFCFAGFCIRYFVSWPSGVKKIFCRLKQTMYLAGFCARENIVFRVFFNH